MGVVRPVEFGCLVLAVELLCGCGAPQEKETPFRSPTRDYPPPPPTTSDGEVVGADRKAPADKLAEGASTEGPAPGWKVDEKGVKYDKRRAAGATDYKAGSDEIESGDAGQPKPKTQTPKQ